MDAVLSKTTLTMIKAMPIPMIAQPSIEAGATYPADAFSFGMKNWGKIIYGTTRMTRATARRA
jgi:hypothetical protein